MSATEVKMHEFEDGQKFSVQGINLGEFEEMGLWAGHSEEKVKELFKAGERKKLYSFLTGAVMAELISQIGGAAEIGSWEDLIKAAAARMAPVLLGVDFDKKSRMCWSFSTPDSSSFAAESLCLWDFRDCMEYMVATVDIWGGATWVLGIEAGDMLKCGPQEERLRKLLGDEVVDKAKEEFPDVSSLVEALKKLTPQEAKLVSTPRLFVHGGTATGIEICVFADLIFDPNDERKLAVMVTGAGVVAEKGELTPVGRELLKFVDHGLPMVGMTCPGVARDSGNSDPAKGVS